VVIARPRTKLYAEHHTVIVLLFGLSETFRYCVKTSPTHRQNFFNSFSLVIPVFTAWCCAQRGIAKPRQFVCLSVCLSVCDVEVPWSHRLDLLRKQDNVQRTHSLSNAFSDALRDSCIQIYLGHDLDLPGSCDITGHVTIWYPTCHFLQVVYCNQFCIFSHFRDHWSQRYRWRHRPRDQSIRHMPFPISVPLEPSLYLQPLSRYLAPKSRVRAHCKWFYILGQTIIW